MSDKMDPTNQHKEEFEPSTLVEYGEAAELIQGNAGGPKPDNVYAS